jgi:hypothetical protein
MQTAANRATTLLTHRHTEEYQSLWREGEKRLCLRNIPSSKERRKKRSSLQWRIKRILLDKYRDEYSDLYKDVVKQGYPRSVCTSVKS